MSHRPLLLLLLCFLLALTSVGCSSQYPTLTFTSVDQHATLTQPYAISAMARDKSGDWNVVLVSQGLETPRPLINRIGTAINPAELFHKDAAVAKDLTPATSAPVRQVIHMTLHWRPSRGATADNPAAANATIRWLIFGSSAPTDEGGDADIIEYQGTVFVRPYFEKKGYTLRVQEGTLTRTMIKGEMIDAMGPTTVEGKLYVPDDPYTVANVLHELPPATPAILPPPPPGTVHATTHSTTSPLPARPAATRAAATRP